MPSTSKGWYKANCEALCLTHKYSVCFVPDPGQFCVFQTSSPRNGHPKFERNMENVKNYQNFVQEKIFGGIEDNGFVRFAQQALNESISDLQDRSDGDEFKLGEAGGPRTRHDVMQLLFKDGSPGMKMIAEKNYGCAVAQVLKYACMVTRHGADSRRFEERICTNRATPTTTLLSWEMLQSAESKWSFMDWY